MLSLKEDLSLEPAEWAIVASCALVGAFSADLLRTLFFWLDGIDLIIHEAGHPILGLLGSRWLMMAGGTIMQLAMPLAFCWDFRRRGQMKSSDACLIWVGQNFLHIGRYAADARRQELPLVGGGEHDWTYLLDTVGLLQRERGVGACFDLLGAFLIALACALLWRRFRRERIDAGAPKLV